jgi:uncharacterized membrane protein YwaF
MLEVVLVMVAIVIVLVSVEARLFMVAVYFWHFGSLVAIPDISEYFVKTSKTGKLFLLSFKLDISDAVGMGEAGE